MKRKKYTSKAEVHNDALKIVNKPFGELAKKEDIDINKHKNTIGDLFEGYFGKPKDSASEPDLGVAELKATPYKVLKNGKQVSAKERLVLNIINYEELAKENFETSHFLHKNKTLELAFYQYQPDKPREEWTFSDVVLYEMTKNPVDFAIIKQDWETIKSFVEEGRAQEISESDTQYLAACTKGRNKKSLRTQPYSDVKAKQRAFSLKSGYMTQLLRRYVKGNEENDAIIKDPIEIKDSSLLDVIQNRLNKYIGMTIKELGQKLSVELKLNEQGNISSKSVNYSLIRKMLGVGGTKNPNYISELQKASYLIKTVQLNAKGNTTQSMSFPAFSFCDLITQDWEDSDLNTMFKESTFIFPVFQIDKNGINRFKGTAIYNFSPKEINGPIKEAWNDTKSVLQNGVQLTFKKGKIQVAIKNNFVKASDKKIIHVRPHSSTSSYIESKNSDKLPVKGIWTNYDEIESAGMTSKYPKDLEYMTKQCFWINGKYIQKIVHEGLEVSSSK